MKPIHPALVACSALLFCTTAAHAVPLTGTMLINPEVLQVTTGVDANGNPYTVSSYTSGSYFVMGVNNPNSATGLTSGSAGGIVLGTSQNFVLNPDVPHPDNWAGCTPSVNCQAGQGYSGTPTAVSTLLAPFNFFGNQTYVGTNPISYQSGNSHPAPTADFSSCVGNNCTLSMDLSSWEVFWNGATFEQGPRPDNTGPFVPAVGTYNLKNQHYSITWASDIKGGPFNGAIGYWHLEGTVVPLPAAAWLFGSGLLGLLGVGRRKMQE